MKSYKKPYRIKRKKSLLRRRFFWFCASGLIIISGFLYLIVFSSLFQIKEINISGNQKVPVQNLQNMAKDQINREIAFFSVANIFLVDSQKLTTSFLKAFPQIAGVELKRQYPDVLSIIVQEREPIGAICGQDACFFVDKEGVVFEQIAQPISLPKINNFILQGDLVLGRRAVPDNILSNLLEISSKLEERLKILPAEVSIISEDRINFKVSENWEAYFNPQEDIEWQLTKLSLVLEKEIPPEKRGRLEYIELRFGDKAYYKYR